jgi:hypothetical protein
MFFLVDHLLGAVWSFFDVFILTFSFFFSTCATTMEVARHLIVNGF